MKQKTFRSVSVGVASCTTVKKNKQKISPSDFGIILMRFHLIYTTADFCCGAFLAAEGDGVRQDPDFGYKGIICVRWFFLSFYTETTFLTPGSKKDLILFSPALLSSDLKADDCKPGKNGAGPRVPRGPPGAPRCPRFTVYQTV